MMRGYRYRAILSGWLVCLVGAAGVGSAAPTGYRPNLAAKLVELVPPRGWDKFVVPVSVHLSCRDARTCASRPGAEYDEAYFSRLLSVMSRDFEPPRESFFFRGGYRGVEFVLAHLDRVISPGLYDWKDGENHNAMVASLIAGGNPFINGYFNVFVTGGKLCGVAGLWQPMQNTPRIFLGPGCLADDDPEYGIYGSAVLAHETMHAVGMFHIVDNAASEPVFREPNCDVDFKYKCHDHQHLVFDRDHHFHPERNHFMGSNTTGLGKEEARFGRPTFFTSEDYSPREEDQQFEDIGGKLYFPARYGFAAQTILACWAYRSFAQGPFEARIPSFPIVHLRSPELPGTIVRDDDSLLVQADVEDWGVAPVREVTVGVDQAALSPARLRGMSVGRRGTVFHFEANLATSALPVGSHVVRVRAVDENGVVGWQSQPFGILRAVEPNCVRFEGCVDGKDELSLASGKVRVTHRSYATIGTQLNCPDFPSVARPRMTLFRAGTGMYLVDGTAYAASEQAPVKLSAIRSIWRVHGRGGIAFDSSRGIVTLDDEGPGGAGPYVVDLCE